MTDHMSTIDPDRTPRSVDKLRARRLLRGWLAPVPVLAALLTLAPGTAVPAAADTRSMCSEPGIVLCYDGTGTSSSSTPPAAAVVAAESLSSIPGVAAAVVAGRCCMVAVNTNIVHDPASLHITQTSNAPIATNKCEYTVTGYSDGQAAPDNSGGVYAVDSTFGAHVGSNSHTGAGSYGPQTTSAMAAAGMQLSFPDAIWTGWSVAATLPWHIRGNIDAAASGAFGQGGKATGSINLNWA